MNTQVEVDRLRKQMADIIEEYDKLITKGELHWKEDRTNSIESHERIMETILAYSAPGVT